MYKVIIHGRGGQGAKTMAMLLAEAIIESGKFAQAFPEYGPERTGAPVRAYVRMSNNQILTKEPVSKPDLVIMLDDSLLENREVIETLRDNPILIVNTNKEEEDIVEVILRRINYDGKLYLIDALEFIEGEKGVHFSAAIFGKLIKITEMISLEDFKKVYKNKFEEKLGPEIMAKTMNVIDRGYDSL
ncbi:MAG: pyruvate synthase [Candidatus Moranbacteria bacterium]|nr:pyruvate synthase [Candidatus Moranbacteria bacterium]